MQDSPQTPTDITNSNSIPDSLGHEWNKMLRGWRDKWGSKFDELQQQAGPQKLLFRLSSQIYMHLVDHWGIKMHGKEPQFKVDIQTHVNTQKMFTNMFTLLFQKWTSTNLRGLTTYIPHMVRTF